MRRDCVEDSNKNRFQSLCSLKTFSGSSQPIHRESAMPRNRRHIQQRTGKSNHFKRKKEKNTAANLLTTAVCSHFSHLIFAEIYSQHLATDCISSLSTSGFRNPRSWSYADGTQHGVIDQGLEVKGAIEVCQRTLLRALPLIRTAVEM